MNSKKQLLLLNKLQIDVDKLLHDLTYYDKLGPYTITFSDGKITFIDNSNDIMFTLDDLKRYSMKERNTSNKSNNISETSDSMNNIKGMSETSDMEQMNNFKMSATSSDLFNGRSDNFSDTSEPVKMNNTSVKFNDRSDNFSNTSDNFSNTSDNFLNTSSENKQIGGRSNFSSDTLMSISELESRKTFKSEKSKLTSSSTASSTKLDMGIFTKKVQSGGAVGNIRKKMMDIGINSNTSTSSICE